VRRGLAIRTRLAIVSATLAVGVLAAGLLTVYLIDRRQVDQSLAASARRAAGDLADSTLHRAPPPDSSGGADDAAKESRPESRDELVAAYLQARSGGGQLLASVVPGARPRANTLVARRLWLQRDLRRGGWVHVCWFAECLHRDLRRRSRPSRGSV